MLANDLAFLREPQVASYDFIEKGFLPGLTGMDHGNIRTTIFLWLALLPGGLQLLKFLPVSPANPGSLMGAQFLGHCAAGITSLLTESSLPLWGWMTRLSVDPLVAAASLFG